MKLHLFRREARLQYQLQRYRNNRNPKISGAFVRQALAFCYGIDFFLAMFSFKSRSVNVSITSSLLLTIFISDGVFARCLHIITFYYKTTKGDLTTCSSCQILVVKILIQLSLIISFLLLMEKVHITTDIVRFSSIRIEGYQNESPVGASLVISYLPLIH